MQLILKVLCCALFFVCVQAVAKDVTFTDREKSVINAFAQWPLKVPADPGNEYSGHAWAEILGAKLFNEPALSADQSISCASCHQSDHGLADGRALAVGAKAHVRNTQGLLNVGFQRWFGWDGGADSLWSASLRPLLSEIEMAADIETLALWLRNTNYITDVLNQNDIDTASLDDESLVVLVSKFMGAYMRTLVSGETSFDQFVSVLLSDRTDQSAYSLSAQRGMKTFFGEGNCFVCHFGANFSNGEFHDIGRPFFTGVGQVDPGRFVGIQRVQKDPYSLEGRFNGTEIDAEIVKTRTVKSSQDTFGQWRTPSLRNLLSTAPYMHDGSLKSLRDVVDYYADIDPARLHTKGEAVLKPFQWTESEREDLVEFLRTLSE